MSTSAVRRRLTRALMLNPRLLTFYILGFSWLLLLGQTQTCIPTDGWVVDVPILFFVVSTILLGFCPSSMEYPRTRRIRAPGSCSADIV